MTHLPEHPKPYPVPPTAAPTARAPQAPTAQKTPGKRGYRWSGGLALTAVLLFGLSLLLNGNPIKGSPNAIEQFTPDETVEFDVGEGEADAWALFSSGPERGSCVYYPPEGSFRSPETRYQHAEGYGEWDALGPLDTSEPGLYRIACTDSASKYALASASPLQAVDSQIFVTAAITVFVAPPLLLAAIVVGVFTALRRSSARKLALAIREPAPDAPHHQRTPQQS
ncbi:hypothetical protein H4W79_004607 [Nocardiopsis terrae]|uniref:Serine/arginine repetitive matrix protein 2 n=1 Tax=Nocardiopsis terrae TaxID=372655 RepID=A0ABR9HN61_9ACTN|nr:hypothetical protein [Nocardiopsis terrae]MBE1460393.1 hypothetical protein [Nocardiopsis terrae]